MQPELPILLGFTSFKWLKNSEIFFIIYYLEESLQKGWFKKAVRVPF